MTDSTPTKIWVLYASQTGNSEQAANKIVAALPDKCEGVYGQAMQLDDFLELQLAPWSAITIICLSSYGVGQAPLGGYRFRELCNHIVDQNKTTLLRGLQFALLGLGDSKYTTFFENPTQSNKALELAGAHRLVPVGKADASSADQVAIVDKWIADLWKPLNMALASKEAAISEERLLEIQQDTNNISEKINPDFKSLDDSSTAAPLLYMLAIIMALLSIFAGFILMEGK
jgi:sulfite reductase alpha subunit-like flavoprotein